MQIYFDNTELEKIYEAKASRKYRLDNAIIKKYVRAVEALVAADTIRDIWNYPAFNFEKLQGADNRFSMRLNIKYRLEIRIEFYDEARLNGDVFIEEVSNHYD